MPNGASCRLRASWAPAHSSSAVCSSSSSSLHCLKMAKQEAVPVNSKIQKNGHGADSDSEDEDVFHEARFPPDEEAVSYTDRVLVVKATY